jgi:hypothetical protein
LLQDGPYTWAAAHKIAVAENIAVFRGWGG